MSLFLTFCDTFGGCVVGGDISGGPDWLMATSSQLSAESLVQQRLFQCRQRGEFLLVESFEALGFGGESVEFFDYSVLLLQIRREGHAHFANLL